MEIQKTILMIPSWYPSKENPFQGSFFKEQALVLKEKYNFIVCRIIEKHDISLIFYIKKLFGQIKPKIKFVNNEENITEYSLVIHIPLYIFLPHIIYELKSRKGKLRQGIGRIEFPSVQNARFNNIDILKKNKLLPMFDFVYSLTSQDMVLLGKAFSDVYKKPHITAEHAPFPWPGSTLKNTTIDAIESADAFLAISSDKVRQVLLQNIKISPFYVWNFCDEKQFSLSNKKNDTKTFLIVAANNFFKNYHLFIRTMNELKKIANKKFKIIIAGYNAVKGYSENAKELEDMIKKSSFFENTEMIESVPREKINLLYNRSDAFVMTSIQEGLPVSAIEASMSGLPVFSTRCGGVEDYIDDSLGKIVSITDYKGLAEACNDFLNGKNKYDSKHIREKAISLFGREAFIKNMSEAFDSVLQDK